MYGTLILPFIALCFLSVMVDRLIMVLEEVMAKIPRLPNKFWGPVAYLIVFGVGYAVCWAGGFDFFAYLGFTFRHSYEGLAMTALLLSGGSAFVKSAFGVINNIPMIVSEVMANLFGIGGNTTTTTTTTTGGTSDPNSPP